MTTANNQNIYFSVIIPAFNAENYIIRAVSSVLNQKFYDYELIIIDDASADTTVDIIKKYAEKNLYDEQF